jgi:hypothetical protein
MYSFNENYANKIISDDRQFAIELTFGSSKVLTGATIQDITLDEIINSTDALTMGCACSNKVTINLINPPTDIAYDEAEFTAKVGLLVSDRPITYEWIPLGKFYSAVPETSNDFKNLKLTAYDGFCKMTGKYNATVPETTTLQAIYDDLRSQLYSQCGITLKERTLVKDYAVEFPYLDINFTQAIGYVAGCLGEVARFDRNGELELVWYEDSGQTITRAMQYMNGFKRTTNKQLTVTSLSTGTSENPIIKGEGANGTQITFENPYITAAMADDIFNKVNNLIYTPCQVKWRGNPAIQAGDIIQVIDKENSPQIVLVMSQTLKIGGGCNATIDCKGTTETKSEFSNRFESLGQKIERVYTTLEKSILDATNAITGNKGGYVILYDTNDDGYPDEILIMNNPDKELATKVWCWNSAGLGYAHNEAGKAYLGPYETAITADGQINASFITTGQLNADLIRIGDEKFGDYIHIEDGVIRFGNPDNPMSLKLGNVEVDGKKEYQLAFFNGNTRIAYFSDNSFEIENLTDGKIRFQNFGFVPRKSGNLSFTKLL